MSNNLDDVKIIKIYNARDDIEAGLIINALEEACIYCHAMESGSGDWMKITQGFSIYGQDIYVKEEDSDRALIIIDEVIKSIEIDETQMMPDVAEVETSDAETCEAKACDVDAYDTEASDVDAYDAEACDVDAYDTEASDVDAYDTEASDVDAYDTEACDVDAYDTYLHDMDTYDLGEDEIGKYPWYRNRRLLARIYVWIFIIAVIFMMIFSHVGW